MTAKKTTEHSPEATDEITIQLTSSQLVTAIVFLLMAGALIFLAGMWARGQAMESARMTASNEPSPETDTPLPPESSEDEQGEDVYVPPPRRVRDIDAPPPPAEPAEIDTSTPEHDAQSEEPPPAAASSDERETASPTRPETLPAPATTLLAPVEIATAPEKPRAPTTPTAPAAIESEALKAAKAEEVKVERPETPKVAPPSVPEAVKPEVLSPADPGVYTVQVAAFAGDHHRQATAFQLNTLEETGLKVDLLPSKDGKWIRAVMGRYAMRDAAIEAKGRLIKQGFKDCWIRKLDE